MKHANALELINVWVHTVVDLSPLIMMGNKKQGASFENKVGLF
jgi:hypothetical protein